MDLCLWICFLLFGIVKAQFEDSDNYTNSTNQRSYEFISYRCTLPPHPYNGKWIIINGDGLPGDEIDSLSTVKIECDDGYRLNSEKDLISCDGNWDVDKFPKCQKKCPPFYSTPTTKLICTAGDGSKVTCDEAINGTYLTYNCSAYYEIPPGAKGTLYCQEGTWDFPKPVCQPVCGKKVDNTVTALSYGGREVADLEYPWVVALYYSEEQQFQNIHCGGSLLSRKIVVTAAHCVTYDNGDPRPKEYFRMVAGKYFNDFIHENDTHAQYRKIEKLIVYNGYKGVTQLYAADIAILVADVLFTLTVAVQPVCINNVNNIHLVNKDLGEVAGWGDTENNQAADRLRVISVPYKIGSVCTRELDEDFAEKFYLFDKICAGHYRENISVCHGDSGSGLVFKNAADNRYYLHGVVSISPSLYNEECNYRTNALYSSVSFYYGFIDREMTINYVEDCVLPEHPKNGRWVVSGVDTKPGNTVLSTTILKFFCNSGYQLSSGREFYECKDTYQTPTCSERCPILDFPAGTHLLCKNRWNQVIECDDATDRSSITYTCPSSFETDLGTNTSTRYCIHGTYGKPRPNCVLKGTSSRRVTRPRTLGDDGIKVICTYVSQWAYQGITPEDFDATLCTHIVYDHIGLWEKGDVRVQDDPLDLDQEDRGLYNRINDLKKQNKNLKVLLSVGGTTASNSSLFTIVSKHARRTGAFLGSAGYFIKTYHFDGMNIDWQYPEESDKNNYINFLEIVKDEFDKNGWLLSASVHHDFNNTGYVPTKMNRLLDWITINTLQDNPRTGYTFNDNALYPSSGQSKESININQIANSWIRAGISEDKLVISVAFYGKSFILKNKHQNCMHSPEIGPGPGQNGGFLRYFEICSEYQKGFTEKWDNDTLTSYRYKDNLWISYSNKESVRIKGEYVKKNGFAGVNVYPLDGDDNRGICGEKHVLLKSLHRGLGHDID